MWNRADTFATVWRSEYPKYADLGLNLTIVHDCPSIDPVRLQKALLRHHTVALRIRGAFERADVALPPSLDALLRDHVWNKALQQEDPLDAVSVFISDTMPDGVTPKARVSWTGTSLESSWTHDDACRCDCDGRRNYSCSCRPTCRGVVDTVELDEEARSELWPFLSESTSFPRVWERSPCGPQSNAWAASSDEPSEEGDPMSLFLPLSKVCFDKVTKRGWMNALRKTLPTGELSLCWVTVVPVGEDEFLAVDWRELTSPLESSHSHRVVATNPVDVDDDLLARRWGRWEWEGESGRVGGQRSSTKIERAPEVYRAKRSRRKPLTLRCEYPRRRW